MLNWVGQLAYLGLISVDDTRMIVNNLYFLTELFAAIKTLSAVASVR